MTAPIGTTGQGSTVVLDGVSACVRSMTLPTFSMDSIDASCLNDTGFMKKIAADLTDAGTVQVTSVFPLTGSPVIPSGDPKTITVTLPATGESETGGILAGSGFISECTMPSVEIGGLLEQTITFTFDGVTGPTWTVATSTP